MEQNIRVSSMQMVQNSFLMEVEDPFMQPSTLSNFHKSSRLNINKDKTCTIWLGSKAGSQEQMCLDHNLNWKQDPFKILGIVFSTRIPQIVELNYKGVTGKIQNTLLLP